MDETLEYDWYDDITRVYRNVVATADPTTGMQRQDAFDLAADELIAMADTGELKIPADQAIRAALLDVDRREGQRSDEVMRRAAGGQDALDFTDDPILDVVVVLGGGRRKQWRDIDRFDLQEMDNLRYRNVRNVTSAYDEWRSLYEKVSATLLSHPTFGGAWTSGAFAPPSAA